MKHHLFAVALGFGRVVYYLLPALTRLEASYLLKAKLVHEGRVNSIILPGYAVQHEFGGMEL